MSPRPLRYGRPHRRRRAIAWMVGPRVCRFCGGEILPGEPWELDHLHGREGGDWGPVALAHRRCNRSDGAERAKAARRADRLAAHQRLEEEREYWMRVNYRPPPSPPPRPAPTPRIHPGR